MCVVLPVLLAQPTKSCFKKLFISVFRSQGTEAPISVLLRAVALPAGEKGGDSWESFQHWANSGNSWALCQPWGGRGSAELVLCVCQAGAGVACRLPQRLAAHSASGEKLLWTELWSRRDSLRGLVQAPDGLLIAAGMRESDICQTYVSASGLEEESSCLC